MTRKRIPGASPTAALLLGVAVMFGAGCESRTGDAAAVKEDQQEPTAVPEIVQKAVAVARELETDPENSEAILRRHGLDLQGFEDLMYEISSDPQLSRAYASALREP